jgi:thiopurine S-methyltransferase
MRARYAEQMARLVPRGVAVLMQTLEYDQDDMAGPPFSVHEEEVRRLYEAAFEVEELEAGDWEDAPPRFADRGLKRLRECCWRLLRRED